MLWWVFQNDTNTDIHGEYLTYITYITWIFFLVIQFQEFWNEYFLAYFRALNSSTKNPPWTKSISIFLINIYPLVVQKYIMNKFCVELLWFKLCSLANINSIAHNIAWQHTDSAASVYFCNLYSLIIFRVQFLLFPLFSVGFLINMTFLKNGEWAVRLVNTLFCF